MFTQSTDEHNLEDLFCKKRMDLSVLQAITNNFNKEQEIGRGTFGVVYKGVLRDDFVAVKKLLYSVSNEETFQSEVDCLNRIKHRNIVRYLGYCAGGYKKLKLYGKKNVMADTQHFLICFEYLHKGSLSKHLTDEPCGLEWHVCYKIIQGICLGLKHLHEHKIIHRDIKPDNILLDNDMSPKITDFGLSHLLDEGKSHNITETQRGTRGYMAPELLFGGVTSFKSDIYSLGTVINKIVIGHQMASMEDTVLKWSRRLNLDASEEHIPLEQVKACIKVSAMCTEFEAMNRPHIQDIVRDLVHQDIVRDLASGINTSLVPQLSTPSKGSEVLPGPSLPTSAKGPADTNPDKNVKCNMLPTRSLRIEWADTPDYWRWISYPNSRFTECAELLKVYCLAVTGEIPRKDLFAGTSYEVYLVYKLAPSTWGLRGAVLKSSLRLYGERILATSNVSLDLNSDGAHDVTHPVARTDGWLEVKLAEFANNDEMHREEAVIVDLREENNSIQKSGLIIAGMEARSHHVPTDHN